MSIGYSFCQTPLGSLSSAMKSLFASVLTSGGIREGWAGLVYYQEPQPRTAKGTDPQSLAFLLNNISYIFSVLEYRDPVLPSPELNKFWPQLYKLPGSQISTSINEIKTGSQTSVINPCAPVPWKWLFRKWDIGPVIQGQSSPEEISLVRKKSSWQLNSPVQEEEPMWRLEVFSRDYIPPEESERKGKRQR